MILIIIMQGENISETEKKNVREENNNIIFYFIRKVYPSIFSAVKQPQSIFLS